MTTQSTTKEKHQSAICGEEDCEECIKAMAIGLKCFTVPTCKEHNMYPCAKCYPKHQEATGEECSGCDKHAVCGGTVCRCKCHKPTEVPQEGWDRKRENELFMKYVDILRTRFKAEEIELPDTVIGRLASLFKDEVSQAEQKGYERGKLEGIDEAISTKNALSLSCEHQVQLSKAIEEIQEKKKMIVNSTGIFTPVLNLADESYNEALDESLKILKKLL